MDDFLRNQTGKSEKVDTVPVKKWRNRRRDCVNDVDENTWKEKHYMTDLKAVLTGKI